MGHMRISASVRACTVTETQALSLWSASYLPLCRIWVAKHGLQPPIEIIEVLQKIRFDIPPLLETQLEPLFSLSTNTRPTERYSEYNSKLEKVATDLSHDLQRMQELTLQADPYGQQRFLTTARDLRRFQRASLKLQFTDLEIVISELMIVSLFSPQRMTLYIPLWLINALPQTLFELNQSFYRPRRTSLAWLLFDAIVITNTHEFKTI